MRLIFTEEIVISRCIPRNYRSLTGYTANSKSSDSAPFESSLERDLLLLLDFDRTIDFYEPQAVTIHFNDSTGKARHYTPDVLVTYRNPEDFSPAHEYQCPLLIEVKYRKDLKKHWKELKPKFKAAKKWTKERNWQFVILTEHHIRGTYLNNVKFIRQYRGLLGQYENYLTNRVNTSISFPTTPAEIIKQHADNHYERGRIIALIWSMVAEHYFNMDLSKPISMQSVIWGP